jgi:hypothetical protein
LSLAKAGYALDSEHEIGNVIFSSSRRTSVTSFPTNRCGIATARSDYGQSPRAVATITIIVELVVAKDDADSLDAC